MTDFARLGIQFEQKGGDNLVRTLDQVASGSKQVDAAADQMAASNQRASSTFGVLSESVNKAAHELMEFARGVREGMRDELQAIQAAKAMAAAQGDIGAKSAAAGSSFAQTHAKIRGEMGLTKLESARMGREFVELGAIMATGLSEPMVVLNILTSMFAHASEAGLGFGGVMKSVLATLGPALPSIAAIGATAVVAFGMASVATRELNKEHQDLIGSLGLTEKQMERLQESGQKTAITLNDVFKGTFEYLKTVVDENTQKAQSSFNGFFDQLAANTVKEIKFIVGGFIGGFEAIKATWKMLPAAIGDAAVTAANAALQAIEGLINKAIAGLNKVIQFSNSIEKKLGLAPSLSTLGTVSIGQIANKYAGAAQDTAAAAAKAFAEGMKRGDAVVDRQFNRHDKVITDAAKERRKDAAGKAGSGRSPASRSSAQQRDTTEEREAQVAQLLAQAHQEELQAQLALTKDVREREAIQKEIAQAELAVKIAQVSRTEAQIADDKGLTDEKKRELIGQLEVVKNTLAHAEALREQVITQQTNADLAKQAMDLDLAGRDAHLDLLKSQQGLAQSVLGRWKLEQKILEETQARERAELSAQIKIAEAQGDAGSVAKLRASSQYLDQIQANQREQVLQGHKLIDVYKDVQGKFQSVGDAIAQHDWASAASDIIDAIKTAAEAFRSASTAAEKIQSIAGLISGIGGAIGGQAGGFLKGAGGGISAASQIGSTLSGFGGTLGSIGSFIAGPVGLIAGGLIGGISSLFGGAAKKQQERRDQENAAAEAAIQQAQKVADEQRSLELRLLDQTDQSLQALAAKRAYELSTINSANQALAKQVYEAEDRKRRYDTVYDTELKFLDLSGDKVGKLAREREEENKAIDATLIPLVNLRRAAEDAADALAQAKSDLQAAYDAEMSRLQQQLTDAQARLSDIQGQLSDAQAALSDAEGQLSDAHDALSQAYDREAGSLNDLIGKFSDFATSLRAFGKSLDVNQPGLSPENQYRAAQAQFADVSARAQMGDENAMGDFQSVAQAFLEASQSYNGVGPEYQHDLASVKDATERAARTAERTVSNAEQQLDQLKSLVSGYIKLDGDTLSVRDAIGQLETAQQAVNNAQAQVNAINQQVAAQQATINAINMQIEATRALVEPLLGINQGVLSLGQAIANYQAAQQANADAIRALGNAVAEAKSNPANQPAPVNTAGPGYTSTNGDYAAYVRGQSDLLSLFNSNSGMAKGRTIEQFGMYHWANFGQYENRSVRPYASGGEFMVGGAGGTDSQNVAFRASPDETVTVRTPQQMNREAEAQAELSSAVRGLAGRLDQLIVEAKADKKQMVAQTKRLEAKLSEVVDSVEGVKRSVRKAA